MRRRIFAGEVAAVLLEPEASSWRPLVETRQARQVRTRSAPWCARGVQQKDVEWVMDQNCQ
eukprot:1348976-Pyramimonas_sp.AAC.1